MSVRQAEEVVARIQRLNLPMNRAWGGRPAVVEGSTAPQVELRGGIKVSLLSPRRKDMDRLANFWEKSLRGAPESSDIDTDQPPERANDATGVEPLVYVVSAHQDERWRRELEQLLVPMLPRERVAWSANIAVDDSHTPLDEVKEQRRHAIEHARIGVVLVSPDALASAWVQEEIAALTSAAADSKMRLAWILVRPAPWHQTPLAKYQALGDPSKSLSELQGAEATQHLVEIARLVADVALDHTETTKVASRRQPSAGEGAIDVEVLAAESFVADRSVNNNASIAFLAEHHGKSLLVCGDANADVLAKSIQGIIRERGSRRLRVDAIVVPHGGSAHNLHRDLLELLDCDRYLFATNGERYGHPDRVTIARILAFGRADRSTPLTLVFNYRAPTTAIWDDPELQRRWNYRAIYPHHEGGGIKVKI